MFHLFKSILLDSSSKSGQTIHKVVKGIKIKLEMYDNIKSTENYMGSDDVRPNLQRSANVQ